MFPWDIYIGVSGRCNYQEGLAQRPHYPKGTEIIAMAGAPVSSLNANRLLAEATWLRSRNYSLLSAYANWRSNAA